MTATICDMEASAKRLFVALHAAMKRADEMRAGEIARAMQESPATISNWKSRGVSQAGALKAQTLFNINPAWVLEGVGEMLVSSWLPVNNVTPVTVRATVPLISWVQAGNFQGVSDVFEPGQADEWVDVSDTKVSKKTFALRVVGDSMVSPYPGEASFPEGTVLVVDPERGVQAGDYVIAKDVDTQEATFKRLAHDAGRWFLRPLNPAYPTVQIDAPALRVIGRVVEAHTKRKL